MDAALVQLEGYVSVGNIDAANEGMKLLQQIKVARITHFQSMVTTTTTTTTTTTPVVTDLQYIQALECGVFFTIQLQDLDNFIRHYQLLQPLYQMYSSDSSSTTTVTPGGVITTPPTPPPLLLLPRKNHIIGLYLMSLLVTASSSEFHSELELLFATSVVETTSYNLKHNTDSRSSSSSGSSSSKNIYNNDPYIQFPISLERKLMVGIYDEIFNMTLPCPTTYPFFMEQLVSTVRDAIADCIEVSYLSLSLPQTATIMKLDSTNSTTITDPVQELLDYIEVAREDWIVHSDTKMITFQQPSLSSLSNDNNNSNNTGTIITGQDVPSQQWIQQTLTYATEMERII